jgi:hypothetical protein
VHLERGGGPLRSRDFTQLKELGGWLKWWIKRKVESGEKIVNDWKLLVILVTIGLSVLYLRKYIGAKAENLAQKEDLRALADIVEGVRAQFERANLVHRVQFEAEFKACQDVWREANNTHREFVRLFPVAFGKPTPFQRGEFISAQLAFADALEAWKPFMNQTVWKAFFEFENSIIVWKDVEMIPKESTKESREEARLSLERCAEEIRKRFSELLVV